MQAGLPKGRAVVLAGTGSNNTKKSIEAAKAAVEAGADAVMVVMPYYSKPTQEGLVQHLCAIAKATPAPIVLYNIPGRSVVELSVDSTLRVLDACPNVVGIKDATGNVLHCQELFSRVKRPISILSGDDALTVPMMSVGATGVISVTSNVYPKEISDLVKDALAGHVLEAGKKHVKLFAVHKAMFSGSEPVSGEGSAPDQGPHERQRPAAARRGVGRVSCSAQRSHGRVRGVVKLALHGASGRMGLAITRLAQSAPEVEIVGAACSSSDPSLGRDLGELAGLGSLGVATSPDVASSLLGADVVIDFSTASAVAALAQLAARQGIAIVSGTSNLDATSKRALDKASELVPVLWAGNMSLGVQVLAEAVELALRRLGLGYDVEIVELHHRKKIDAPSGTASRLVEAVKSVRPDVRELRGRDGEVGARTRDEMAVFGVRGGDVIGDHTVYLLGDGERLELTHRASNRDLFAHGALRAARFLAGKKPGRYSIADVLG